MLRVSYLPTYSWFICEARVWCNNHCNNSVWVNAVSGRGSHPSDHQSSFIHELVANVRSGTAEVLVWTSLSRTPSSSEALADLHTSIVIQHKRPRSLRLLQDTDVEDKSPLWVLQSQKPGVYTMTCRQVTLTYSDYILWKQMPDDSRIVCLYRKF